jgi:hypothetical protein
MLTFDNEEFFLFCLVWFLPAWRQLDKTHFIKIADTIDELAVGNRDILSCSEMVWLRVRVRFKRVRHMVLVRVRVRVRLTLRVRVYL